MPRPLCVLVVDDDPDTAVSTADLLVMSGYDVRAAFDGPGAVGVAERFHPDVLVLDIGLPGEDGYAVAARLCALLPRRPVLIAVTGYNHLDDRSRLAGFDHHFLKPIHPRDLTDLLAACAGRVDSAE